MKNGDKAAITFQPCGPDGLPSYEAEFGLTKRETMAMHIMAGMFAAEHIKPMTDVATVAVTQADALLAALERTGQGLNWRPRTLGGLMNCDSYCVRWGDVAWCWGLRL